MMMRRTFRRSKLRQSCALLWKWCATIRCVREKPKEQKMRSL